MKEWMNVCIIYRRSTPYRAYSVLKTVLETSFYIMNLFNKELKYSRLIWSLKHKNTKYNLLKNLISLEN